MIRSALAGILALSAVATASAQQFPTVPYHTVIGRIGAAPGDTGPSQAIPFATLLANLAGAQAANKVYAGPTSGIAVSPTFRLLVGADVPAINLAAGNVNGGVTGATPIANGGTGQTSRDPALTALMPTPTRAGDLLYWNGTNWVTFAGNNSGTQILTENASGVPSWAATGSVSSVTCGTGLSGGTITTAGTCALALNSAVLQANPANPTGTTSTTGLMMGLGVATCRITPTYSSRVKFEIIGAVQGTGGAASFTDVKAFFGTGAGPANAAAITGTQVGNVVRANQGSANVGSAFVNGGIATGLTPGTAIWIDISIATNNVANTSTATSLSCNAFEVL